MATLKVNKLFFTTSPRTPSKMIPEIKLLCEKFSDCKWNRKTQAEYIDELANTDFFEGKGSSSNKDFSARDRITRAPKALGFVNLKPTISLTDAGKELVYGSRPQEIFLRQLLKFQLPSPYHTETTETAGNFCVRPYLEIIRLIRELEYITFDEFKIFAIRLTDYRKFEEIKNEIIKFREEKELHKGQYKKFVSQKWTDSVIEIYKKNIQLGKTKTRETLDASLKKFISTKKGIFRDYADACFRYLRYTGLVSVVHKSRKLTFFDDKLTEVDFILTNTNRQPVFIDDIEQYQKHLFCSTEPVLYTDNKDNITDILMRIGNYTKRELIDKTINELKDLKDKIVSERKSAVIHEQVTEIKSYSLYSEIIDTFNEIISDEYYDAPLMMEYNTWRAMTMLNGGSIKGNFKFDDVGQPLSTASGNMPDIECDYDDFMLSVEVTLQNGQRQYESEGEPVARHYGQMKKRTGKDSYCLFITPNMNDAAFAHFYALNKMDISYYGGKTKIIPLELDQFMRLVENSYNYENHAKPSDVRSFLDSAINEIMNSSNEQEWKSRLENCVNNWLIA